jgi:hypothetical protein
MARKVGKKTHGNSIGAPIGSRNNPGGRPTIFGSKENGSRVQGGLTKVGTSQFDAARLRLAALVEWEPKRVSDGDVIEYLSRGHEATQKYLRLNPAGGKK